ncbi:MAG: acyl-CoA dehydrogenase family protein [Proteobacteria bacterium]|nr:acyl-CoA dehydrogenase family protein [Pseudomonadota bacterium]
MAKDYFFNEEHDMFRESVRRFVQKEITPRIDEWEEKGCYDRAIFNRLGELDLLGLKYPEEYGGANADIKTSIVFWEELSRCGGLGFVMSVMVQTDMATPSLAHAGSHELKQKFLTGAIRGEKLFSIGITEPDYGSDAASIKTRAVAEGDFYRVNGAKMFITNGTQADVINCVVRTGGPGSKGVSLLLIETDTPGFSVGRKLNKMGNHSSDTAELIFEDCMVPRENLVGEENKGFYALMGGLEMERLSGAALSYMGATLAMEESIRYATERTQFGKPLMSFQVLNHMIADMATEIEAGKRLAYHAASMYDAGQRCNKEVSMAKYYCSELAKRVCDRAVQIHGGYGYMREFLVERLYRDVRLYSIGGGTSEIQKNVILAEMGLRV